MKTLKYSKGFTLIELMMVLVVLTVLLTIGVPSFQEAIRNNRLITQVNSLISDLNVARSEAIKRGARVAICKSADQSNCTTSGNWEQGRIVFVDLDADGTRDAGEEIIQTAEALSGGNTLRTGGSFSNYLAYRPTGRVSGNGGNQDTFELCDTRGSSKARSIVIILTGRPRLEKGATSCP